MDSNMIVDSCVDFNEEVFPSDYNIERIPFIISIDNEELVDKNLNINTLISKIKASTNKIVTACPSPNDFLQAFQKCKNNFVVTISSKLSGSYNSAIVAKDLAKDEDPDSFVYVFDSKTAAAGESLVALKIKQLIEENMSVSQIIEKTNNYISNLKTLFVLESLDTLIKNGRVTPMQGIIGSVLHIMPIMGATEEGGIELKAKARGRKNAIEKLIDMIGHKNIDFKNTILGITHVNAKEKALAIKDAIQKKYSFKEVIIFQSGGLSTVYANDQGIVISF